MWPFRRAIDRPENVIAALRLDLDDAWEHNQALSQQLGEAEIAMKAMQRALSEEGLTAMANKATAEIADIYASGGGGVRMRDIRVNGVIRRAVRLAATGEVAWNEGERAVAGYKKESP